MNQPISLKEKIKAGLDQGYLKNRNKELKLRTGVHITATTCEKYERSLRYMIDFLEKEFAIKNYPLIRIDGKFLEKYFPYIRTVNETGNKSFQRTY